MYNGKGEVPKLVKTSTSCWWRCIEDEFLFSIFDSFPVLFHRPCIMLESEGHNFLFWSGKLQEEKSRVAKYRVPGCIFKTWTMGENKIRMGARKRQTRNRRVRESWDCQLKGIMLIMLILFYLQFLLVLFPCYSFFESHHGSFLWMKTCFIEIG